MFQKDGKLEVEERADEARGHIQPPGRDEGGDGGDILEKVNEKTGTTAERIEAKGVGHERGVKVRLKQQGMKIFLKAGSSLLEGQESHISKMRRPVDFLSESPIRKEEQEREVKAVPGARSDCEDVNNDDDKTKVENVHDDRESVKSYDENGKRSDKVDKTKPEHKKQGKSVKIKALKPAKQPKKSIKPNKKVNEELVNKITIFVEEKEVETSQPEPRCLAPASQNDWVCSSQVVPSLVVSVQNLSHVTHQTKQQQQQSNFWNIAAFTCLCTGRLLVT